MSFPPMPTAEAGVVPVHPMPGHALLRRRLAWLCAVLAAVTGALAGIGVLGAFTGYLLLDAVTGHVAVSVLLTLGLLFFAVCLLPVRRGWRNALRAVAAAGLALVYLVTAVLSVLLAGFGEAWQVSPDGANVVVVSEGADAIDPVWTLTVRQSSRLVARSWPLGCFNGDDPNNALDGVRWVSDTQVEVSAGSGDKYVVVVDPENARPARTLSAGCES